MQDFIVSWFAVIKAEDYLDAAEKAKELQRNPADIAGVFHVKHPEDDEPTVINLNGTVH